MRQAALLFAALVLSACVEEPSKKDAGKASEQVVAEDEAAALKNRSEEY